MMLTVIVANKETVFRVKAFEVGVEGDLSLADISFDSVEGLVSLSVLSFLVGSVVLVSSRVFSVFWLIVTDLGLVTPAMMSGIFTSVMTAGTFSSIFWVILDSLVEIWCILALAAKIKVLIGSILYFLTE